GNAIIRTQAHASGDKMALIVLSIQKDHRKLNSPSVAASRVLAAICNTRFLISSSLERRTAVLCRQKAGDRRQDNSKQGQLQIRPGGPGGTGFFILLC